MGGLVFAQIQALEISSVLIIAVESTSPDQSVSRRLCQAQASFGVRRMNLISVELYDLRTLAGHLEDLVPLLHYSRCDKFLERGLQLFDFWGRERRTREINCWGSERSTRRTFTKLILLQSLRLVRQHCAPMIAHHQPIVLKNCNRFRKLVRHIRKPVTQHRTKDGLLVAHHSQRGSLHDGNVVIFAISNIGFHR